jgi:hypothetical protein
MNTPSPDSPPRGIQPITVAVLGFTAFEKAALRASLRSGLARRHGLTLVEDTQPADWLVADADLPAVVDLVAAAGRTHECVFIGEHPPATAMSWMDRPIDARRVIQTLSAMADMDFDDMLRPKNSAPGAFAPNTDWAPLV